MLRKIKIADYEIAPGQRATVDLPVARLYTHTSLAMPVHVIHGRKPGPVMFVSAAIHGDEINGVEIIRRLLKMPVLKRLRGTLLAIPIVNVHGFLDRSRSLPDRRDLNRTFPGSSRGSLASRVAHIFMTEIVEQSDYGIDLHTGAEHRSNLPQIRARLEDEQTRRLAEAFGTPVIIDANLRDGSLRQAAVEKGIPMLLYEAGEALRFDELSIRAGVRGIINVMRTLDMLPAARPRKSSLQPVTASSSSWVRATESGILRAKVKLGATVEQGERLGVIADPFGEKEFDVISPYTGLIVGLTNLPLVHEGEGLFHLARFRGVEDVSAQVEAFQEEHEPAGGEGPEEPII
jgi:predicted deacylase